jgi:hypothetical protein
VVGIALVVLVLVGCAAYFYSTTESEEQALCRRFMELKNANDPAANDLLGPPPAVPAEAVAPEEADRLHAEFFLHGDYQVVSVSPETAGTDGRFVLALRGAVSSPRIPQLGPDGTDVINRSMSDPDLIVRVAENKIRAVSFRLHHDANEKRMSEPELRRLRQAMEEDQRRQLEFWQGTGRSGGKR